MRWEGVISSKMGFCFRTGRVTGFGSVKGMFVMSRYLGNEFQFGTPRDYVCASAVRKR
jgi:hypothetical protein